MGKKKKEKILTQCPNCGAEVLPDDFYCKNCNAILTDYRTGRIKNERTGTYR